MNDDDAELQAVAEWLRGLVGFQDSIVFDSVERDAEWRQVVGAVLKDAAKSVDADVWPAPSEPWWERTNDESDPLGSIDPATASDLLAALASATSLLNRVAERWSETSRVAAQQQLDLEAADDDETF